MTSTKQTITRPRGIEEIPKVQEKLDEAAVEEVFQHFKHVKPRLNRAAIGLICDTYRKIVARNMPPQLNMADVLKHMTSPEPTTFDQRPTSSELAGMITDKTVPIVEKCICEGGTNYITNHVHETSSAFNKQEAGDHYRDMKSQPFHFLRDNGVPHAEGECIYKLLRWRKKGGIADLRKVIHTIELIIEAEEGRGK